MRSKSMQSLTDDVKHDHPGVVIYGVGDDDHKLRISDHNEDDTPGSLAAQSDADSTPEHRAIDAMLGPAFTKVQAYALIAYILASPALLKRLRYIIFDGWIWSRSNGWRKTEFTGADKHRDHIHFSGDADDDANTAPWLGDDMQLTDKIPYVKGAEASYSQDSTTVGTMLGQTLYYVLATRNKMAADAAADKARDEATLALLKGASGGSVDVLPVLERINAVRDEVLAKLEAEFTALQLERDELQARLAEALKPTEG